QGDPGVLVEGLHAVVVRRTAALVGVAREPGHVVDPGVLHEHAGTGLHAVDAAVDVRPVDAGTRGPDAVDGGRGMLRYELGVLDHRVVAAFGVQQTGVAAGGTTAEDAVAEGDGRTG